MYEWLLCRLTALTNVDLMNGKLFEILTPKWIRVTMKKTKKLVEKPWKAYELAHQIAS